MIYFKNSECNLGEVSTYSLTQGVKTQVKYSVSWEYETNTSDLSTEVILIKPDCGCTAALTFSPPVREDQKYIGKLEGTFSPDIGATGEISKRVVLYLNDGTPLYVSTVVDGAPIDNYNDKKAIIQLYIKGTYV